MTGWNFTERQQRHRGVRRPFGVPAGVSCWPSWPFAARPRFIAGRDLGSRPLVPNVGLVGFLLSATAASKGRERKARDVRCHKIAFDPICLGLCTMEPNYLWAL